MNDHDERFYFTSLLHLLSVAPDAEEAAQQILVLLERLFAPCQAEIWLASLEAGHGPRCINPQGRFSRFAWSADSQVLQASSEEVVSWPGRWKVSLGAAGYLLLQSAQPMTAPTLKHFVRCCQLAIGTLQTLLQQDRAQLRIEELEERQRNLATESSWLQNCLSFLQTGGELLEPRLVREKLTPVILQAFPGDGLVLGLVSPEGWMVEVLQGGDWPAQGSWSELWDTSFRYAQVIHFAELAKSRFADAFPQAIGLTVAPLGFAMGVLCRYSLESRNEQKQSLRNFEIGAQLLGCLLKISQLHGQVSGAYDALKESEMQRANAVKLAAIGQIAAGVAHEINNPLAAVKLTLDGLGRDRGLSEMSRKTLGSALHAVSRCQEVARELLSFSRESSNQQRSSLDLQEAARRAAGISEEWARSRGLSLRTEWHPEPLLVEANMGQLQEIVLNLIENAFWAVEQGQGPREVVLQARTRPGWVEIVVKDAGPGVADELAQKIFEPFFTTRPMGEATGLGLAISRRLAQGFEGDLWLEETSPEGSSFCLRLPAASATMRKTLK